jgi:hypothetical protein
LLLLLAPALAATELALLPIALVGGWLPQKLGAWADVVRAMPRLAGERRSIQRERAISSARFAAALTPALGSPFLGAASRSGALAWLLRGYWRIVGALLGRP